MRSYHVLIEHEAYDLTRFEDRVKAFRSGAPGSESERQGDSWLNFWSNVGSMVGFSTNRTLEEEIALREASFADAQRLYNQMRVGFLRMLD